MGRCMSAKLLSRYLDDDLVPTARREVQEHMAACAACRRRLLEMEAMDEAVRRSARDSGEAPDVSERVVGELRHRGAFVRARMAAGRRQVFGGSLLTARMAGALAAAAVLLVVTLLGTTYLTHEAWARRTAPVMVDARKVLVRLVAVESPSDAETRLVGARETARELDLSDRLAQVRLGADPALAGDLTYLETTFTLLARGDPLPAGLQADLQTGEALGRAEARVGGRRAARLTHPPFRLVSFTCHGLLVKP